MIRLIATDLDGTLLDDKGHLPADFFEVLYELKKRNIIFAAASGRSAYTIKEIFIPHQKDVLYISDNGTYICTENFEWTKNAITKAQSDEAVEECLKIGGLQIVICTKSKAYFINTQKEYVSTLSKYYICYEITEDYKSIDEEILKVAVFDPKGSSEHSYPKIKNKLDKNLAAVVSSPNWFDIMNIHASKGVAIKEMQKHFGISKDETMAFGDFDNDIEMLKQAKYSFAMANSSENVKKIAEYETSDNNSFGVIKAIKEHVLKD